MPVRIPCTSRHALLAAAVMSLTLCVGGGTAVASSTGGGGRRPTGVRGLDSTGFPTATVLPGATATAVPGVSSNGIPGLSPIGAPVHAVFLGDSYTYGIGATVPSNGYAYLLSEALHWNVDIIGLPGSGYTRVALRDGLTIAAGIQPAIAAQPQVLIVECGRNDADPGISVAKTKRNALRDLRALRAGLPDTTIVVLGPVWLNGRPTPHALAVRNALYAVQEKIPGSVWIDPIAQRWFTGRFVNRTGDDATMINYAVGHPNNLGYLHIAQVLEADLQELQIG